MALYFSLFLITVVSFDIEICECDCHTEYEKLETCQTKECPNTLDPTAEDCVRKRCNNEIHEYFDCDGKWSPLDILYPQCRAEGDQVKACLRKNKLNIRKYIHYMYTLEMPRD